MSRRIVIDSGHQVFEVLKEKDAIVGVNVEIPVRVDKCIDQRRAEHCIDGYDLLDVMEAGPFNVP